MDVIIDGQVGFEIDAGAPDVLAVVAAANDHLRSRGRGMVALKIDGRSVGVQRFVEALQNKPLADVNTLEILSEDLNKLVQDSLAELKGVLPDLPQACHSLAAVFQSEEPEAGYSFFQQLAEIWRHIKEMELLLASALDAPLATLMIDGQSVEDMHKELNAYLNEAVDALARNDTVILGDLLEYELAPRAEAEMRIVALLEQRAANAAG